MEANIEIAQSLFQKNKYQETIDICKEILATDNNSIEAIKLISKSFLAIRKIDDARFYFDKALTLNPDDYEVIQDLGNTYHAVGDMNNAKKCYQKTLTINSQYAPALTNLGSIELKTGNKKEALSLLIKATESEPKLAPAWGNLANCYVQLGKIKEAEIACRKAIELGPNLFNSHFLLASILIGQKKLLEAEKALRKTIELKPDFFQAHLNLGSVLKDLGQLKEAEISTRKAIEIKPDYAEAHYNLGIILNDLGKFKEAELSQRKAIEIKPNYAAAHSNLGIILRALGKLKEAELSIREAIRLNPNFAEAYLNLGLVLKNLDKLHKAESSVRKAIELKPDYAKAHSNLGIILKDFGHLQEAEIFLRKAIELKPNYAEMYLNLALIELLKGNYQSGLENYEFRLKTKKYNRLHGKPKIKRVNNIELQKKEKLLVICEQGLGDTLQYMRYIPYLKNQGLDVSFCAQEKLHSLIKASNIDQHPLTPEEANQISEGQWIPLLSLPRYLQVNPNNPIISEPYIFSTIELKKKWKNILSTEKRPIIGINWQGNPNAETGSAKGRSLPLKHFHNVALNNNVTLLSLQKGFGSEQLDHCSFKNKFVECQSMIDSTWDFLENAAIIENCDLIITCDTSIAHLAGGMGKKVWLLLKDIPYWTWGLEGKSTFWYPSMRLFRQKDRHDWQEVIERISNVLKKEIEAKV